MLQSGDRAKDSVGIGIGVIDMDVSKNSGTPKIIQFNRVFHYNHPFWGPLFLETPIYMAGNWLKDVFLPLCVLQVIYDQEIDPKKAEEFSSKCVLTWIFFLFHVAQMPQGQAMCKECADRRRWFCFFGFVRDGLSKI